MSGPAGALRSRVLTAMVLAAVLLVVVLGLPEGATLALVALVVLAGAWEWSALLGAPAAAARGGYVLLVAVLLGAAWAGTREPAGLRALLFAASAWWLVALLWLSMAPGRVRGWSAGLAGLFALVPAGISLAEIRLAPGIGAALTLFALVLIVAADTGAFFAGRRFGRVHLAPRVSPGKTWEGVIGGLLLAALIAWAGAAWFDVAASRMLPVGLAAAAFSVVGDLTESMLKRHAGVKDSGSIFPGHGGVLDRIDSVTAGAPVLLLGLLQIEVVA
ncbi:MAG: phosphatidate cytidylyltransferase [Steroidobacteraceae bacterium]|nr:phosphatidate cytidylyltransferase [Steroidobacteraceae bacterium]